MKLQNLSVRAFLRKIVAGTLLTAALLLLIFFLLTKDVRVVICGIILTAAFFIWGMVFLHYFQKKLSLFTDGLCQTLDHMQDVTFMEFIQVFPLLGLAAYIVLVLVVISGIYRAASRRIRRDIIVEVLKDENV